MHEILFVCLGNICRSPAAEGILLHLAKEQGMEDQVHVESCGLGDWHIGKLPDERMRQTAQSRGITLTSRAKEFQNTFFDRFQYILAADQTVLKELHRIAHVPAHRAKLHLMSRFSAIYQSEEIPDPYYGGQGSFDLVFDMLEDSCQGLLNHLFKK